MAQPVFESMNSRITLAVLLVSMWDVAEKCKSTADAAGFAVRLSAAPTASSSYALDSHSAKRLAGISS